MPYAVTTSATMTCPHAGTLTVTPTSSDLKASNNVVINKTETLSGVIAGCTNTSPGPCVSVASVSGESTKLTKTGVGVILGNSTIQTNTGFPITIVETQTVLQATS